MVKETVPISWYPSKQALSVFTETLFKRIRTQSSKEQFYREISSDAAPVGRLIYDLGHNGRLLDDFPRTILIDFPVPSGVKLSDTTVEQIELDMPATDLLTQLQKRIQDYFGSSKRGISYLRSYVSAIATLEVLAKNTTDLTAHMLFGLHYDNTRFIESVKVLPVEKKVGLC